MEIHLALALPRDVLSIPVARHICRDSLHEVGVTEECASAIEVALTEACTNVLLHSGPGARYENDLGIDEDCCSIRVIDAGDGFDAAKLDSGAPDGASETGRGVLLMRALVDRVLFTNRDEAGTIVHLEKELAFLPGAPGARLRLDGH